jgi:hypothetical protein
MPPFPQLSNNSSSSSMTTPTPTTSTTSTSTTNLYPHLYNTPKAPPSPTTTVPVCVVPSPALPATAPVSVIATPSSEPVASPPQEIITYNFFYFVL